MRAISFTPCLCPPPPPGHVYPLQLPTRCRALTGRWSTTVLLAGRRGGDGRADGRRRLSRTRGGRAEPLVVPRPPRDSTQRGGGGGTAESDAPRGGSGVRCRRHRAGVPPGLHIRRRGAVGGRGQLC